MSLLSQLAHNNDLAIAQKNTAEILDSAAEIGTDFAINEECNRLVIIILLLLLILAPIDF